MRFPNLEWAIAQFGSQFRFAALLGESESWLSRRLTGRVEFSPEDRDRVAQTLGFRRWSSAVTPRTERNTAKVRACLPERPRGWLRPRALLDRGILMIVGASLALASLAWFLVDLFLNYV